MKKKLFKIIKLVLLCPKYFLGYIIYFLSGFIPRKNNIWVLGNSINFRDNSRYLYEYLTNNPQFQIRAIWIAESQNSLLEAKKYGEAYHKYSLKGFYYCLLAKVYIFSAYISEINFFTSRKAIIVNLWHGIPIKKIEFDIYNLPLVKIFREASLIRKIINPWNHVKYDFLLSPSQYVANYSFKSAFRLNGDENIILGQYPRVSHLIKCESISKYKKYKNVFLYVPTWRDGNDNFFEKSSFNLKLINHLMLENNALFLIKFHIGTENKIYLNNFGNIKIVENTTDPIELMKTASCLITDYSSIYFDYLILDRPIFYFSFDLEDYLKNNREMYFNYDENILAGEQARSFDELLVLMKRFLEGYDDGYEKRQAIKNKFLDENVGGNEKIVQVIQEHLLKS